jgi:hypothetical protein
VRLVDGGLRAMMNGAVGWNAGTSFPAAEQPESGVGLVGRSRNVLSVSVQDQDDRVGDGLGNGSDRRARGTNVADARATIPSSG